MVGGEGSEMLAEARRTACEIVDEIMRFTRGSVACPLLRGFGVRGQVRALDRGDVSPRRKAPKAFGALQRIGRWQKNGVFW